MLGHKSTKTLHAHILCCCHIPSRSKLYACQWSVIFDGNGPDRIAFSL